MEKIKNCFRGRNKWLSIFTLTIVALLILSYCTSYFPLNSNSIFYPLVTNYGGNISSGIIGGFLFLFLTFYLDANTEEKIKQIHSTVKSSEESLQKREKILANEQSIFQFEQFIKNDSYHNIRFPTLVFGNHQIGLEYTIEPVRDSNHNPIKKISEMNSFYIIKIRSPACWEVMNSEDRQSYDESPIRDDEYYYCSFFNDSWYMSTDGITNWHEFYLSSKIGPVEFGETANEFMTSIEPQQTNLTKICTLNLKDDGTLLTTVGGCTPYNIYQNINGKLFLQIWKSRLKPIYLTNQENTYDNSNWFIKIDHIRGYAHGNKLRNIIDVLQNELSARQIEIPKVPWYESNDFAQ